MISLGLLLLYTYVFQEGDRKLFTSPVKPLTDEGFIVACVGYDFATLVGLNNVVEQAAKALDVREIYLSFSFKKRG